MYEMLTGRLPFAGETVSDCIASILKTELPQITAETKNMPSELQRIVRKTLAKKREERYQTVRDLLIDLKDLRRELDLQAALEHSVTPDFQNIKTNPNENAATATITRDLVKQAATIAPRGASSAEYVVNELKRNKLGVGLILAAFATGIWAVVYFSPGTGAILTTLILGVAAVAYFFYSARRPAISSIAVLPFNNTSNTPNTEYLSDGISESLINNLSQLPNLKVIARSSSFRFRGKDIDLRKVARALDVEAILNGWIVQRREHLQISVELVNARDMTQLWGEQYDRKTTDLLQMQSEISREIAEKLCLRLSGTQARQLAKQQTTNPQAYESLLKGKFYWNKGGTENRRKAIEYYNQAIAIDPSYALAYAELSASYDTLIQNSTLYPKEFAPKAETAAQKAVELDENLADGHYALAHIKRDAWKWREAERQYKRAIELNSNHARAHSGYAMYLSLLGRHEQAIKEINCARELDPLSILVNLNAGFILQFARRYDEAIEVLKKTLELDQNHPVAHLFLGYIYAAKQMYAEAITAYQEAINLGDDSPSIQIFLGAAYAEAGEVEKAQAILRQLETSKEYVSPGELAILYDALGEREQAFVLLEKAYAEHDLQLQYLKVDPAFDNLRQDPRFLDLLQRTGLPR